MIFDTDAWCVTALWGALLVSAYIFIGYPVLVVLLSRLFPRPVSTRAIYPRVTIIIPAHNEQAVIAATIENKLSLAYPRDALEILVVSDGSGDATDSIVAAFHEHGVRLLRQEPRAGKTAALNRAVMEASGDIIAFSDANSMYDSGALARLVANFADPAVGYVTGRLEYVVPSSSAASMGSVSYIDYEHLLRRAETRLGSIVGVNGGIDAVRRSLYRPMRADQLPDFVLPLWVIEQGHRVVYEPQARSWEETPPATNQEYRMRVRVALRAFNALKDMRHLLSFRRYGVYAWQLLSHKVLRYLAFLPLMTAFLLSFLASQQNETYAMLLYLQLVFIASALLGWLLISRSVPAGVLHLPFYFLLANVASAHALLLFMLGRKKVTWSPRTG